MVQELILTGKEIDDKRLLVEAFLLESKIIFESKNIGKSRASLTACRANANQIQVPRLIQAEIETMAGMLHLEEHDYQISYSYFYESFELFLQIKNNQMASELFCYMILSKIMNQQLQDVKSLLDGRYGEMFKEFSLKTRFMGQLYRVYQEKSLIDLYSLFNEYKEVINED